MEGGRAGLGPCCERIEQRSVPELAMNAIVCSCSWRRGAHQPVVVVACLLTTLVAGCVTHPTMLRSEQQTTIDRQLVEYPANSELKPLIEGLTGPVAITFDNDGSLIVAEGGIDGRQPRIFGFKADGTFFDVFPRGQQLPFKLPGTQNFDLYGPIGGMAFANGKIYVTHRTADGRGAITAFGYDGTHSTIVADLPAEGDYSVTDIVAASNGRLHFGVGAATNSGVVGIDNMPWLLQHRSFCDQSQTDLYLLGRRFDTVNPFAGLFGGSDIAVTAPFQPFGKSIETRIPKVANDKPNAAIYSVDPNGGDLRVEAHGVRYPAGMAFNELGRLYMTNQGMKLRGTRPVKDDPDVLLRLVVGQWYGFPDYSADLVPIRDPRFQPPEQMIVKSGYRDLSFLIDHETSRLTPPNATSLLAAEFPSLAGAAKFSFVPASGPFSGLRQAGMVAIVALSGDRAPFDTGNQKLVGRPGYKLVQVNVDQGQVKDFIKNTLEGPASLHNSMGLERPIDAKFGPDGALYVLDFGQMEMDKGQEKVKSGTGRIFKLVGLPEK